MGEGRTGGPQANQRLTVAEAAEALGITEGAVRSRIKRGTLPTTREGGAVFVLLGGSTSQANQSPNTDEPPDQADLVAVLREQLALEREAHAETRRLFLATLERIPAIEPPQEDAAAPEASEPRPQTPGPQTGAQRPWWRRVFGG